MGSRISFLHAGRQWLCPGLVLGGLLLHGAVLGAPSRDAARVVPIDLPGRSVPFQADSGLVAEGQNQGVTAWELVAGEEGATWVRIFFSPETRLHRGGLIRLTSLYDGAVQHLDA